MIEDNLIMKPPPLPPQPPVYVYDLTDSLTDSDTESVGSGLEELLLKEEKLNEQKTKETKNY